MLLEIPELYPSTGMPDREKRPSIVPPKVMASFSDDFTSLSICSKPIIFWICREVTKPFHRCPKFYPFKFRPFH